jgi:hypothetical protein
MAEVSPLRRALLVTPLLVGVMGFLPERPEGGAPDHPDDPRWVMFRGVKVDTDLKRGVATARFPPDLLSADNEPIEIGGYIIPLESASFDTSHFLLTRRSTGCPFCPPNEANEAVEVFTTKKVHYESRQFFVKGRLKLVASSDNGLFFQIHDAVAS